MNRAAAHALFDEQVRHIAGDLLESRTWRVFQRAFPILDVGFEMEGRVPFRVQMSCEDWNDVPPAIALMTFDGAYLTAVPTGPTGIFHAGPHDVTKRPFICMAGSREYHTYSGHVNDLWDNYKNVSGYSLGGILEQIWSAWLKSHL
jgi:hypothetical protein